MQVKKEAHQTAAVLEVGVAVTVLVEVPVTSWCMVVASFWGQVVVEEHRMEPGLALAGVVEVAHTMVELGRQGVEETAAHGKALTALMVVVGAGPLVD